MAKIDLDSLSIEELAGLRENAADKLFEKVATRRAELEAELEKLAHYGKPVKKAESAPAPKAKLVFSNEGTLCDNYEVDSGLEVVYRQGGVTIYQVVYP